MLDIALIWHHLALGCRSADGSDDDHGTNAATPPLRLWRMVVSAGSRLRVDDRPLSTPAALLVALARVSRDRR